MVQFDIGPVTYDQKRCAHNTCLNHKPIWVDGDKQIKPSSTIFGKRTYWLLRCCGKPMTRYKEQYLLVCKECGATEPISGGCKIMAVCKCCGKTVRF